MPGYDDDLRLAHVLADAVERITTARFRAEDLHVDTKPDLTLVSDADRAYFGAESRSQDQVGYIDGGIARFGKTYAGEPEQLVEQLVEDEAIAAADTLMLTVPNQLGVEYNAHAIESILKYVAPELGWR